MYSLGKEFGTTTLRPFRITPLSTISLCTAARSPKKNIGEERLSFTFDNRVPYHVIFPGMCGK